MNVHIEMNDNWERDLRREIEKNTKRKFQSAFDRLVRTYEGQPKEDIRRALERELGLEGDLEAQVEAIHSGTPIKVEFEWA